MQKTFTDEELTKLAKSDPFKFKEYGIKSCIGDNSGHSPEHRDFSIADGFKECVDILYITLINQSKFYDLTEIMPLEDTLVYPFWFSCRHTIEVYLKLAIKRIYWIWNIKEMKPTQEQEKQYNTALRSHDIKELVEIFKILLHIDNDTKNTYAEMKHFDDLVADYFFDCDADEFRYTYKPNQKDVSLGDKKLINLSILYEKFLILYQQLDWFCNYVCPTTLDEYRTATFTSKLNRNQIEEISKLLPSKDKWTTDEFLISKKTICSKYSLSSTDFAKVIDLIKCHREFSANIGVEIRFNNLTETTIKLLCELIKIGKRLEEVPLLEKCYTKYGGIMTTFPDSANYSEENYIEKLKIETEFDNKGIEFLNTATEDEICLLHTFKELAQVCGYHSENLEIVFERWKGMSINADYTLGKLPFGYEFILKGLIKCGQNTYLGIFKKYL